MIKKLGMSGSIGIFIAALVALALYTNSLRDELNNARTALASATTETTACQALKTQEQKSVKLQAQLDAANASSQKQTRL